MDNIVKLCKAEMWWACVVLCVCFSVNMAEAPFIVLFYTLTKFLDRPTAKEHRLPQWSLIVVGDMGEGVKQNHYLFTLIFVP